LNTVFTSFPLLLAFFLHFAPGCTTVSVDATFPYPEKKPLTAIKNLIVLNDPEDEERKGFPVGCGRILCGNIESDITRKGHFSILEREKLARLLEEKKLAQSDLFASDSLAAKMGCLAGADGMILVVLYKYGYSEQKMSSYRPVYDHVIAGFKWVVNLVAEVEHTPTMVYERKGAASVEGRIRLIDTSTAEILREAVIPSKHGDYKKKANREPDTIDYDALLRQCRSDISRIFATTLYPSKKNEVVVVRKGGGLLGIGNHELMDKGVEFAKEREWEKALEEFAKARESIQQGPDTAKERKEEWCSLMNMAMMHACLAEFDSAYKNLVVGEILLPTADFSDEYAWVQHRKRTHEAFQAQFNNNRIPAQPEEEDERSLIKRFVDGISNMLGTDDG